MKSKSIANSRVPCGTGEVERPRGVTYRVTCHEWLIQGVCASRTFPTICVQRCSVAAVSCHASSGSAGQASFRGSEGECDGVVTVNLPHQSCTKRCMHEGTTARWMCGMRKSNRDERIAMRCCSRPSSQDSLRVPSAKREAASQGEAVFARSAYVLNVR